MFQFLYRKLSFKEWRGMDFASSTRAAENRTMLKLLSSVVSDDLPRLWGRIEIEILNILYITLYFSSACFLGFLCFLLFFF